MHECGVLRQVNLYGNWASFELILKSCIVDPLTSQAYCTVSRDTLKNTQLTGNEVLRSFQF